MAMLVPDLDMSALVYCSSAVLLQGCTCGWDQMDMAFLCKQFAACLVDFPVLMDTHTSISSFRVPARAIARTTTSVSTVRMRIFL